ncbi:hypothetical protein FQN57_007058 [Myotisia sp. PD_48]|nr:hypothetical protein FQN57_007058 [Myotisia sp. PD_48]
MPSLTKRPDCDHCRGRSPIVGLITFYCIDDPRKARSFEGFVRLQRSARNLLRKFCNLPLLHPKRHTPFSFSIETHHGIFTQDLGPH